MNDTVYRRIAVVLACVTLVLLMAVLFLSDGWFARAFDENGIAEWLAFAAWLLVAAIFAREALQGAGPVAWLAAPLCLAAALREADMHKTLTGYSVLKLSFYGSPAFAVWQKLLAALVVIPAAVGLVALSVMLVRRLRKGGLHYRSVRLVLAAIALLVFTKVLDRSPALIYEWFDIQFAPIVLRLMLAFEEGLEALLPFAFLVPFMVARGESSAPGLMRHS
jgi:hypothetical protein